MPDNEHEKRVPIPVDMSIRPTDEKLKSDAGKVCEQYLQFWDPGEVEVTVVLSRPGARTVAYGTSIQSRDRLNATLDLVKDQSKIQTLMFRGSRKVR